MFVWNTFSYLLYTFGSYCLIPLWFLRLLFVWDEQTIGESGILKYQSTSVWGMVHNLTFTNVSFQVLVPLNLRYSFWEVKYNIGRFFLISMKYTSPSFYKYASFKSILLDINMSTLAIFLDNCLKIISRPLLWDNFYPWCWGVFALCSKVDNLFLSAFCFVVLFYKELGRMIMRDINNWLLIINN